MRSEHEMLHTILEFAQENERVRAVIMNGSRANPHAPRDIFQDYDIVFLASSVDSFVQDRRWINSFGELIIMQTPDEHMEPIPTYRDRFAFLMLFTDGNRIDLTLYPADNIANLERDSLSVLLLDKDGLVEPFPPPSLQDYITVPPTAQTFANSCNEFWWVSTYVAKGLWRRELPYAKFMLDRPVRDMLHLMLEWHIGIRTDSAADPGKQGKYFEQHLEPEHWTAYVQTFADADYEHMWQTLFRMGDLFREVALEVANHYSYEYPAQDDQRVTYYLHHVQALPADTKDIF
ncbi:aminoglycoside adenylyltransferase [Paenibacillus sp. IHB B 3084]|uniref:aminoglycoside 6-adenylyltransferase n=1 Tax=Paenibacillus sp. IHB B 3084 TaxID=867076 RepID=UPI0007207147|nr:aminoglycoside 6-adenylyltransferase [Paenibacillus sp. IHB B 3084]ALP34817.1 aminoglycoside adenylyltransferase [Paenibacillus sp. IHB B 3084]